MAESWGERYEKIRPKLEKKRFVLPEDEAQRRKLELIREEFEEFGEAHPEIYGLTLYGSFTKGYAVPGSDIDGILFFDPNKTEKGLEGIEDPKVLSEIFKERLSAQIPENEISFTPEILGEKEISDLLEGIKDDYEQDGNISPHVKLNQAVPFFEQKCKRLGNLFFGISVGRSLEPYRKFLIEKLIAKGMIGQKIWEGIISSVEIHERPRMRPGYEDPEALKGKYESLYPQTLKEAWDYYIEHTPFRQKKN